MTTDKEMVERLLYEETRTVHNILSEYQPWDSLGTASGPATAQKIIKHVAQAAIAAMNRGDVGSKTCASENGEALGQPATTVDKPDPAHTQASPATNTITHCGSDTVQECELTHEASGRAGVGGSSEISVVAERDVYLIITNMMLDWKRGENLYETGQAIVKALRPYLRTTEPDEVSSWKGLAEIRMESIRALQDELRSTKPVSVNDVSFKTQEEFMDHHIGNTRVEDVIKAVLDAAGVAYE